MRIVKTRVVARWDEAGEHITLSGRYEEGGIATVDSTEDVKGNENANGKESQNESFADVKGSKNELVACELFMCKLQYFFSLALWYNKQLTLFIKPILYYFHQTTIFPCISLFLLICQLPAKFS